MEVKYDEKFCETGNVFIELSSRGKTSRSGLFRTSAEWFIIILKGTGFVIMARTRDLRKAVEDLTYDGKAVKTRGGDKNTSIGLLMRPSDLFEIMK